MLYQRVRPKSFDDVVGNEAAVTALRKAVAAEEHAHCYLLHGPSGCGKTTLARILAEAFGCPPNKFGLLEINAALERGIDMSRELRRNAQFGSIGGKPRTIILDEAHMLTREAQNGLLKVLEDIPDYIYYMLCSTEPAKLLKTIRTRCDSVEVRPLRRKQMADLVYASAERAGIDDPAEDVIAAIVAAADGCPRTALVLLEKQNGMKDEDALAVVQAFELGTKEILDLCRAVVSGTWKGVRDTYKKLDEPEPEKIRRAVLGYLHSCLAKADGEKAGKFADMIEELSSATYDSGKAGLLAALFQAAKIR